jgi:YVTN family beta-propeller protein
VVAVLVAATFTLTGCGSGTRLSTDRRAAPVVHALPGRLRVDVYRADAAGDLSPVVRHDPALVYVPNSLSNTVDVISQKTMKVIRQFPTGALPQHVTPAYDLKTLYVDNDQGNSLTPINPRTGLPGRPIPVADPPHE